MTYRLTFTLGDAPAIATITAVSIGAAVYEFYRSHPGAQLLRVDSVSVS